LALPLPPWPRRLVPEVFRNRLAQHTANGLCTCAPSELSTPPRRSLAQAVDFHPVSRIAALPWMRHAFLRFFSPSMRVRASFYPPQVPSRGFVRRSVPCLALSRDRVCGCCHPCDGVGGFLLFRVQSFCSLAKTGPFDSAARPGFVGCPHALFAPCLHTCRACLIPTASLGFSLQRIDFVLSRMTSSVRHALLFLGRSHRRGSVFPAFQLLRRTLRTTHRFSGRLRRDLAGRRSCRPSQFTLAGWLVLSRGALSSCEAQSRVSATSGAASRAAGHFQFRSRVSGLPRSSLAVLVDFRWLSAFPFVLRRSCVIAPSAMGQGSPVSTGRVATVFRVATVACVFTVSAGLRVPLAEFAGLLQQCPSLRLQPIARRTAS